MLGKWLFFLSIFSLPAERQVMKRWKEEITIFLCQRTHIFNVSLFLFKSKFTSGKDSEKIMVR